MWRWLVVLCLPAPIWAQRPLATEADIASLPAVSPPVGFRVIGPDSGRMWMTQHPDTREIRVWTAGSDVTRPPLYRVDLNEADRWTTEGPLLVVSHFKDGVQSWSVYRLGSGKHLFDSTLPLQGTNAAGSDAMRFTAGFYLAGDDEGMDVGLLSIVSPDGTVDSVRVTCDDVDRAAMLRMLAQSQLLFGMSRRELVLGFQQGGLGNQPPVTTRISVPIIRDRVFLTRANVPRGLQLKPLP